MKHTDLTYALLHNLSPKNFKKFESYLEGKTNELQLAKAFKKVKQCESDDDLKKELPKAFHSKFRLSKNRLKNELLDFIYTSSFDDLSMESLSKELHFAKIMYSYSFKDEAIKQIHKVIAKAEEYNYFDIALQAMNYLASFDDYYRTSPENATEYETKLDYYLDLYANQQAYKNLSLKIYACMNIFPLDTKWIEEFETHPLLGSSDKAKSVTAKLYYFYALMDLQLIKKNYEGRLKTANEALCYVRENLVDNDFFFVKLMLVYERYLHSAFYLDKYDEIAAVIAELEQFTIPGIHANDVFLKKLFQYNIPNKKLKLLIETNDDKGYYYLSDVYVSMLSNNLLNNNELMAVYYNLFYYYTVRFHMYHSTMNLFYFFNAFFSKNIDNLVSTRAHVLQSFVCIFLSAYKVYNAETFQVFIKKLFHDKSSKYFEGEDAPYNYVLQLRDVIQDSFENGIFYPENFNHYGAIWSEMDKAVLNKALFILKNALIDEYNQALDNGWIDEIHDEFY